MSHQVETMMYHGATPWHGLGKFLEFPPSVADGIRAAGLDWQVSLQALAVPDGRTVDQRAVVRQSDSRILGVVGPKYVPVQNADSFAWFQPFLDAGAVALHTAGSLDGGRKVWVLAKVQAPAIEVAEGDAVSGYVLLSNSHDGSQAVRVGFTPIRVVCANTLSMAHRDNASQLLRVRHTRSVHDALALIRDVMDTARQSFEATAAQFRRLAACKINATDLRKYVRKVFDVEDDPKLSTRQLNVFRDIERLFYSGRGAQLPAVRGTVWVAYNAVNEHLGYQRGRSPDTRLDSLWFGEGQRLDRRALSLALDYAQAV
jgi:phage/plasmid-like protein (TIGR03299 family)